MTQPTDEELDALLCEHWPAFDTIRPLARLFLRNAMRAAVAKWSAAPQQAAPAGWIDPNDKTQAQYLPHIGEPVLFCHGGKTYWGKHTGGGFVTGNGVVQKYFSTWECRWQYPPVANGIKGGQHGADG